MRDSVLPSNPSDHAASLRHARATTARAHLHEGTVHEDLPEEPSPSLGDVEAALEAAVEEHQPEIDECLHDAPNEASGSVTIRLVITPEGTVRSARPRAPAELLGVGQCLARVMRSWTLSVPGATSTFSASRTFEIEANTDTN